MNKVAVITGTSRGLGLALAKEFAAKGWHVIGTGRSPKPADMPQAAEYHQFDAASWAECEAFWQQVHQNHSGATLCLVNNAGGYVGGSLTETTPEAYGQQMQSAYFTSVYMTRGMALSFEKARIINIISAGALTAHKGDSAYGAAKAAQMHFFRALQEEYKADKYQITNIYPHSIASHGPAENAMAPDDLADFVRQQAENEKSYYIRDVTVWQR
jgi:serine 3-dehydrogenase (NADP+)